MSDVNPCISQDLWINILQRLPVKSLGKCRCVCKSWYALVASPLFMAAHLKYYTQNDSNSLFLHKDISIRYENYEQCDLYRDSTHFLERITSGRLHTSTLPFMQPIKKEFSNGIGPVHLVDSINGLLCLSDCIFPGSTDRIFIWNPLLQKAIQLPKSLSVSERNVLGFGYNSRNNDYVVIKFNRSMTLTTPLVEIYSVQERKWRTISAYYLFDSSKYDSLSSRCFLNGFIHWLVSEREPNPVGRIINKWLLVFNVAKETFYRMELPPTTPVNEVRRDVFAIFEYQRKLALSRLWNDPCESHTSWSYEIWVQEGINSWCKILKGCVPDCHRMGLIQYVGMNGEVLGFYKRNTSEIVSYDPKTKQTKGLGLFESLSTRFISYSESLVLLDHNIDDITPEDF